MYKCVFWIRFRYDGYGGIGTKRKNCVLQLKESKCVFVTFRLLLSSYSSQILSYGFPFTPFVLTSLRLSYSFAQFMQESSQLTTFLRLFPVCKYFFCWFSPYFYQSTEKEQKRKLNKSLFGIFKLIISWIYCLKIVS